MGPKYDALAKDHNLLSLGTFQGGVMLPESIIESCFSRARHHLDTRTPWFFLNYFL